ncbi:MAG: T9SS type A sorting domain-containing protein [Saprospiraceae bacterium]|nr:T9SS type A sorting domain-containing protein [Candidatus Vicinibacter affinis]
MLLKFFSTDKTASPWFLGSGCTTTVNSADQIISDQVNIYPNPGNGLFYLESDKEIESLELFNLYGLKLNFKITSSVKSTQIDLSDLKKGVYLLHVKFSNSSQTKSRHSMKFKNYI